MNVFIIPSWYPSVSYPSTGIFFKEQAQVLAKHRPDWNIGISVWGSHEPGLWLPLIKPLTSLFRYGSKPSVKRKDTLLEPNCAEFLTPAFTWTRKIKNGNIEGIIQANEENFDRFIQSYGKPDVIHAHVAYPAGYIAQRLSEKHHIPFVITEHMSPFPHPTFKSEVKKLLVPPLQKAIQVIVVGQQLANELKGFGVESIVVDNFIDFNLFNAENRLTNNEEPVLFHLGRLEGQKNQIGLLDALAECKDFKWQLIIGGEGRLMKRLKVQTERLGLSDRVTFRGHMSSNEIVSTLKESSLFLMPSKHESYGVAALEALASGVPVLMTKCGGIDEKLTSEVSCVVEHGHDYLVEGLQDMLGRLSDFNANEIRSFAEKTLGPEIAINKMEAVYRSVVKSSE